MHHGVGGGVEVSSRAMARLASEDREIFIPSLIPWQIIPSKISAR